MICIHLTVTGTTRGQGTDGAVAHVQTSHYSACNNHAAPLLPVFCFHSWHTVRPRVASSSQLQCIPAVQFYMYVTSIFFLFPDFILESRSSVKGQMASRISVALRKLLFQREKHRIFFFIIWFHGFLSFLK